MSKEIEFLYLNQTDVRATGVDMALALKAVEDSFRLYHQGQAILPHKVVLDMGERERGRGNAMPAYVGGEYNVFGIKWIAGFPKNPIRYGLPRGTGLYVHTARRNELAYYAVLTRVDGIENTSEWGPANSLAHPVTEEVAEPEPDLQGELPKMPFFNYEQRRLHFVRWLAPPYSNRPYDYSNWSAGVPNQLEPALPLELNLHRDGYR